MYKALCCYQASMEFMLSEAEASHTCTFRTIL